MAKKKHKTRTGALTNDTGAAERAPKTVSTTFKTEQNISFTLVDGQATVDLGTVKEKGRKKRVGVTILENEETASQTWSIDLAVDAQADYPKAPETHKATKNNITGVEAKWHHIPTNTNSTTNASLFFYSTSGLEDTKCNAVITIINQ